MSKPTKRTRPAMQNYGIHANDEGLLTWEWVSGQMEKSRNYWICSTRPDGRPHAAPVWGVWLDETLYFGSGASARKTRNLRANPAVVVHLESGDETVIFEGTVEDVTAIETKRSIAEAYFAKYPPFKPDPESDDMGVTFRLKPRVALAWLEKDFPRTATRWTFKEA